MVSGNEEFPSKDDTTSSFSGHVSIVETIVHFYSEKRGLHLRKRSMGVTNFSIISRFVVQCVIVTEAWCIQYICHAYRRHQQKLCNCNQTTHLPPVSASLSKKVITGLMAGGSFTYFSQSLPPSSPSSSSPPTSDSDQTSFPQGRVYQEIGCCR